MYHNAISHETCDVSGVTIVCDECTERAFVDIIKILK